MKKRILLVDESLTVQKVVSLTLDKGMYQVVYARNRQEVVKMVVDMPVDLILLSENVSGLPWQSFPKELESWMGKMGAVPPVVLITGQEIKDAKHYVGVLKKPFTPQSLQELVDSLMEPMNSLNGDLLNSAERQHSLSEDTMQTSFNRAFSDEEELVRQTFSEEEVRTTNRVSVVGFKPKVGGEPFAGSLPRTAAELWEGNPSNERAPHRAPGELKENTEDLWGTSPLPAQELSEDLNMMEQESSLLTPQDSMAYKSALEHEVKSKLHNQDLYPMVEKALAEILPPIVERLVQERLDQLLKEQEESLAS